MKKLILSLVALVAATMSYAQTQVATLSHGGVLSVFYGSQALINAHAAATNGDVITLSSGAFATGTITKAVTIRGAGMENDTRGILPTMLTGDFTINIPDSVAEKFTLEGVYSNNTIYYRNLKSPMFIKCRLGDIIYTEDVYDRMTNASFVHCKIAGILYLFENCSANCVNCVVKDPFSFNSTTSVFGINNCVVLLTSNTAGKAIGLASNVKSSAIYNSVIFSYMTSDSSHAFPSSTICYNNVSNYSDAFRNSPNSTNKIADMSTLFNNWTTTLDDSNYTLLDSIQTAYLGTDGTQVGIYGGNLPFDPTPTNPQITRLNVAGKSNASGILSVDVEVKIGDE